MTLVDAKAKSLAWDVKQLCLEPGAEAHELVRALDAYLEHFIARQTTGVGTSTDTAHGTAGGSCGCSR